MKKTNILFPIETINRELDFRLFLAVMTKKNNNRIFVGQHDVVDSLVSFMSGGIYVGKNVFKQRFPAPFLDAYINLKKHNIKFIHIDEEGAVYPGDEKDWKTTLKLQLNPNYLTSDDYICTWGEFQADYYKSRKPACQDNIFSTGHPRFDLNKPEFKAYFAEEANSIKDKFGDFVLFNTNLSFANHGLGITDIFTERWYYYPKDFEKRTEFFEHWVHKMTVFTNILKLISRLSGEFPKTKFIVRPHPSEDISYYETVFKDVDNVEVIHEGAVTPWILASRLLIHDGCTTAIEAHLSKKPIINYQSNPENKYNLFLPNNVGLRITDEDETVEVVQKILDGDMSYKEGTEQHPMVYRLMDNFKENSFEKLIRVIEKAEEDLNRDQQEFVWNERGFRKHEKMRLSKDRVKSFVRPLFKEKQKEYNYFQSKFYGFEEKDIKKKTDLIKSVLDKDFKVRYYNQRLLIFE